MTKLTNAIAIAVVAAAGFCLLIPLGTLFGATIGYVVGAFFGDSILNVLAQLGVKNVTMWQFGAFLGFVGPFFKATITKKHA